MLPITMIGRSQPVAGMKDAGENERDRRSISLTLVTIIP